ncbi:MAG: phage tail tube protein [Lacrimispora sp.]|uniref:phage tail tube protein n=1 Tax=Lacrimispora sp. TaxID=2719234 RepID=UPI0039E49AF8
MGNYTKITDLVTGCEGSAFITTDGQNRYFFEMSKIDASIEFTVIAKKLLGHRMKQHKVVGAEGKGTMTLYNVSPAALVVYQQYIKEGKVPQISIQITNEDPSSTIGKRTVVMRNCILAKTPVVYLEDGSEELNTVDTDFTFDDLDDLESYVLPENMR